jgi:hypothetical protein
MDENFNNLVSEASNLLEITENYQWELGRISNDIVVDYGYKALEDFSKQVLSICGVKRTAGTLRMYAYVWKISVKLDLPKDILFSACQSIVFSDNPEKYAELARAGLSGTDIRRAIYDDKYSKKG